MVITIWLLKKIIKVSLSKKNLEFRNICGIVTYNSTAYHATIISMTINRDYHGCYLLDRLMIVIDKLISYIIK